MASKATETMGSRLKMLRDRAGLSQEKVARELNVSVTTVSRWERDVVEDPETPILRRLAMLYDASIDFILNGKPIATVDLDAPVPAAVEDAIAELGDRIDDDVRRQLRATNWHASAVTLGTVRSYALDLMLVKKGARAPEPSKPPPRRAGRRTLKK